MFKCFRICSKGSFLTVSVEIVWGERCKFAGRFILLSILRFLRNLSILRNNQIQNTEYRIQSTYDIQFRIN
jgi:hypothetical protein